MLVLGVRKEVMPNPFGIALGSTPDSSNVEYILNFRKVPNPHPDLVRYDGRWDPNNQLTMIGACSKDFENDDKGLQALATYDRITLQLQRTYGIGEALEQLDETAIWDHQNYFSRSIFENERAHAHIWNTENAVDIDSRINTIILSIQSRDAETTFCYLTYRLLVESADMNSDVGQDSL
jgi:hypothetical protein